MENFKNLIDHLGFLGYQIHEKAMEPDEEKKFPGKKQFLAKIDSTKNSFFVSYLSGNGFSFLSSYHVKPYAKDNKLVLLELLNKITLDSYLCSFTLSEDSRTVFMLSWYPDYYSKSSFGVFLDRIDSDVKHALSKYPELLNFIE